MQNVELSIKTGINPTDYEIGVIIMRAQVQKLTPAHTGLINLVKGNHKKVIIFLGIPAIGNQPWDIENCLDFATRRAMIQTDYPDVIILPLNDMRDDDNWSELLDKQIGVPFGRRSAILYGGRDSFIKHYRGKYPCVELISNVFYSGTESRKEASQEIVASPEWRAGIIHSAFAFFPMVFSTVDIAAFNDKNQVLLAKKPLEKLFRFIGGFVDISDTNKAHAARREFHEETGGCEVSEVTYLTDGKIDDWRYRGKNACIMSTLFTAKFAYGSIKPSDDICELAWVNLEDLVKMYNENTLHTFIMPEHIDFMRTLLEKRCGVGSKNKVKIEDFGD